MIMKRESAWDSRIAIISLFIGSIFEINMKTFAMKFILEYV